MRRRLVTLLVVLAIAWGGLAATAALGVTPKLGLDLQGGTSVILRAPEGTDPEVLELSVERMRSRIENFGNVQEPEISISGDNSVLVQLPGVEDQNRALDAIGQTGQLSFRPVLATGVGSESPLVTERLFAELAAEQEAAESSWWNSSSSPTPTTTPTTPLPASVDPETGITIADDPTAEAWIPALNEDGSVAVVYHLGPAFMLGSDVDDSQALFSSGGGGSAGGLLGVSGGVGQWYVSLDFTSDGSDLFAGATAEAASFGPNDPRRQIAIVLDGEVVSAPRVNDDVDPTEGITGGSAQITLGSGEGIEDEAGDLAVVLRYGALPVSFERDQVQKVSATLGQDSLQAGLVAGIGGLILVLFVLLLYYRSLALIAVFGISVFGALLVTIFSLLGAWQGLTLTLAGVAGVIVSIGITADSYIVFFERVKEELRRGRSVRAAVNEGFARAFRTIVTADSVSILGAMLLWLLAVGPVKGFALALGIATAIDLFVAYYFTRPASALLARTVLGEGGAFSIAGAAGRVPEQEATA